MQIGEFIGPYLPIGECGPYPVRLRQQFEGVVWRFKTGGLWREMPQEFSAWSTVHNRFRQWRDAGVFEALLEGVIMEAAKRGEVDLSLVSVDSTTVRARHDDAGMHLAHDMLAGLEKAAEEAEMARQKKGGGAKGQDGAGHCRRPGTGRVATCPTWTQAPPEGGSARAVRRRADQQDPHRRRVQVPPVGLRPG